TTLYAMEQALQAGPVLVGVNWYSSFDDPDASGYVTITSGASVRGGHEFLVRGIDPGAQRFHADNSWGADWGDRGMFQFSYATMERLLSEQGDCTVPVPAALPAPVPVPMIEPPTAADAAFGHVLTGIDRPGHPWIDEHHSAYNRKVQQ